MHLATANVAVMRATYGDPLMADFIAELDPINAIADDSPGFVWRFDEDDGNEEAARSFGIKSLLFNMSVWESVEALEAYAYKSDHVEVVRKRAKWFEKPSKSPFVLWWIDDGYIPSIADAKVRLELLWANGPTADAFTFGNRFPPR